MKPIRFLVLLLALVCPLAHAQPGPNWFESMELKVARADSIFIGHILRLDSPDDHGFVDRFVVQVTNTLKGNPASETPITASFSSSVIEPWFARQDSLLILVESNERTEVIPLRTGEVSEMTEGFRGINNPDDLVREVKRLIPLTPGLKELPAVRVGVPRGLGKSLHPLHETGMGIMATVPVNAALEKLALDSLRGKDGLSHSDAVRVIGYFHTAENVALLKSLLTDNSTAEMSMPNGALGHKDLIYPVRSAAYDDLVAWNEPVDKPELERDVYEPDSATVFWQNGPVSSDRIQSLSNFPNLKFIEVINATLDDDEVAAICRLPHIETLHLDACKLGDGAFKSIGSATGLKSLSLNGVPVSASDIVSLASLRQLSTLSVTGHTVDDNVAAEIGKLTSLTELGLSGTAVSPAGILGLAPLKSLQTLRLSDSMAFQGRTDVDNSFENYFRALGKAGLLRTLSEFTGPKDLRPKTDDDVRTAWFYGVQLTDGALEELTRFRNLENLMFDGHRVTSAGIEALRRCPHLRSFNAEAISTTEESLRAISQLKELESINFSKSGFGDKDVRWLVGLPNLHRLILSDSHITDTGLALVAKLPSLQDLFLSGSQISDEGIGELAHLRTLKFLSLFNCSGVSDRGVEPLVQLPNLSHLTLWGTKVSREGVLLLMRGLPGIQIDD